MPSDKADAAVMGIRWLTDVLHRSYVARRRVLSPARHLAAFLNRLITNYQQTPGGKTAEFVEVKGSSMEEIEGPSLRIVIPGLLLPDAAAFLHGHGCGIDTRLCDDESALTMVTLPPDSRRRLIMRTASERHRLTLPDGIAIVQIYDPGTGKSALLITAPQEMEVHNGG